MNRTSLQTPASRASVSAAVRSGPSPTMRSLTPPAWPARGWPSGHAPSAWSRAKTSTTSVARFTFRKLETWTRSCSPSGAMARLKWSFGWRLKRSVSTKLGIVSTSFVTSNEAYVSLRSQSLTAVTPFEASMACSTTGLKLGSFPMSVMSVPWSVVTTGTSRPFVRRICWARTALVAWGMA